MRAYLQSRHARTTARLMERRSRSAPTPADRLLAIFDAQAEMFAQPGFRGCAFVSASAEAPPGGLVEQAADEYRDDIRSLFVRLATKPAPPTQRHSVTNYTSSTTAPGSVPGWIATLLRLFWPAQQPLRCGHRAPKRRLSSSTVCSVTAASGVGVATIAADGTVLDTWFPAPELAGDGPSGTTRLSVAEVPADLAELEGPRRGPRRRRRGGPHGDRVA